MIQNMIMNMNRLNKVECAAQRTAPSIIEGGRGGRNSYRQKKNRTFLHFEHYKKEGQGGGYKTKDIYNTRSIYNWGYRTDS